MPHKQIKDAKGRSIPSVTEILKCLDKPYLDKWKEKLSLQKLKAFLAASGVKALPIDEKVLEKFGYDIETFWKDAEEISEEAAKRGRSCHDELEQAVKEFICEGKFNDNLSPLQKAFVNWFENNVTGDERDFLESEETKIHPNLGFQGTPDLVTKTLLIDFKFGKRINAEYWFQLGGYGFLNPNCMKGIILRFYQNKKGEWKIEEKSKALNYCKISFYSIKVTFDIMRKEKLI